MDEFLGLDILNELQYTYNTNRLKLSLSTAFLPKRGQLIFINFQVLIIIINAELWLKR